MKSMKIQVEKKKEGNNAVANGRMFLLFALIFAVIFITITFAKPSSKVNENSNLVSTTNSRATPDCSICEAALLASNERTLELEKRMLEVEQRLVDADKKLLQFHDPESPNSEAVDVTAAKIAEVEAETRAVDAEKRAVDAEKRAVDAEQRAVDAEIKETSALRGGAAEINVLAPMLSRVIAPVAITSQTFAKNPGARKAHVSKCAGARFEMFVHDPALCKFISAQLLAGGWECQIINPIAKVMTQHPGESFMDIGSNIGAFSLTFAHLGYRVFAFEAMQYNAELQVASIGSFPMKGELNLFNTAVASETGGELCVHPTGSVGNSNSGNGQVSPGPCKAGDEIVPSYAIGDIMKQYSDVCIAAMKIDVEGYEGHALRGAESLFTNGCPPCAVFFEYNKEYTLKAGLPARVVFDFLSKRGYVCSHITGGDWKCLNKSPEQQQRCH
jgi:FkbM family methyltransferase